MIEFIPFGVVAGIPIGVGFFFLARRRQRAAKAWGPAMWALAAPWLGGAAALPSMAGGAREAAVPVVFLAGGCFVVQLVMLVLLLLSGGPGTMTAAPSKRRIVLLLAILSMAVALSLAFAFVL
jgi:hypothetical protein